MSTNKKIIIIGGGIFGCTIAHILGKLKHLDIDLVEKENDLMKKASLNNHNRIHYGYHYLRSNKTAKQSLEGIVSFLNYYGESVHFQFDNYYAINKVNSKSNSEEFIRFCNEVGIDYEQKYPSFEYLNSYLIEDCFKVPEPIFDYNELKKIVKKYLYQADVSININTEVTNIVKKENQYHISINNEIKKYDIVINATYSEINKINKMINYPTYPYLYEDVLIPILNFPSPKIGVTVMDGNFASFMPMGNQKNKFLLYNVIHSVINSSEKVFNPYVETKSKNIDNIIEEIVEKSVDWFPFLQYAQIENYYRATRVIIKNDTDERLSNLLINNEDLSYFSVFSGKITTCVKLAMEIKTLMENKVLV